MYKTLTLSLECHIATITLDRPEVKNAINQQMVREMIDALDRIWKDHSIRVIIITGANGTFCAGADLKERMGADPEQTRKYVARIKAMTNMIASMPIPVIAAIYGHALGGGLEIPLACDIIIAANDAKLGCPEVRIGVIPGAGGTQRLSRRIGLGKAKMLILTGKPIDGLTAGVWGLADQTVSAPHHDNVMFIAKMLAEDIIQAAPIAVRQAKKAIDEGLEKHLPSALRVETSAYNNCLYTRDRLEGLAAFREKRRPVFKGE